jgi:TonB family protein
MRKTTFVRPFSCGVSLFCLAALGLACLPASSQDAVTPKEAAPAAATTPTDPKALMLLAAKTNGLTGPDVQPWHLKASFKLLDEKGNTTDQGTYEEFWVSPTKYKRTFTSAAFTQTLYGVGKSVLLTGAQTAPPGLVAQIRRQFVGPMLSSETVAIEDFDLQQREAGDLKLACLRMKDAAGTPFGPTWCLDADEPVLRMSGPTEGTGVAHYRTIGFQGRFIAGDLQFVQHGKIVLTAHLDSIETIATADEAVFLPPHDATPAEPKVFGSPSGAVAAGILLKKVQPEYPLALKDVRVAGTVVLKGVVGKDGRLRNLRFVSGSPLLQQAAMDAVKQWLYRPYLLNGEPLEVETTVNVLFALSPGSSQMPILPIKP